MPRRVFLWLVLAGVLTTGSAHADTRFAFVIGSNRAVRGQVPLKYAERDAIKFRQMLIELGHTSAENVALVLSPSANQMREALEVLLQRMQKIGGPKTLFVYYSGHADSENLLLGKEMFSLGELKQMLASVNADMRIGIIDACQSGAVTSAKGGKRVESYDIQWEAPAEVSGMVWISSSAAEETSIESDDVGGSLFSHFFVSASRGAGDQNRDGKITLTEAFDYAYSHTVERSVSSRAGAQHPAFHVDLSGRRDFVLSWLEPRNAVLYFDDHTAGTYLVFDRAKDDVVAEVVKDSRRNIKLSVPPGDYYLKKRLDDHILLQKISLGKGVRLEVRDDTMRTIPYEEDVTKGKLASASERTWKYDSPPIYNTAYTMRRGTASIGFDYPTAVGISDDVTLMTDLVADVALGPNLATKVRLLDGPLTWSVSLQALAGVVSRLKPNTALSTLSMGLQSAMTIDLGSAFLLTGQLGYALSTGLTGSLQQPTFNYYQALYWMDVAQIVGSRDVTLNNPLEQHWLSGEISLLKFTGENRFLQLTIGLRQRVLSSQFNGDPDRVYSAVLFGGVKPFAQLDAELGMDVAGALRAFAYGFGFGATTTADSASHSDRSALVLFAAVWYEF